MSATTEVKQRGITGFHVPRECCPDSGMALAGGDKTDSQKLGGLLPPSGKIAVDISSTDFTVPEYCLDRVRGISVNASGIVVLKCINDDTADQIQVTQGMLFPCQPYIIEKTNTTATGIYVWF